MSRLNRERREKKRRSPLWFLSDPELDALEKAIASGNGEAVKRIIFDAATRGGIPGFDKA
jgi:hypothetical protein